jgi:DNA polymerase-1
MVKLFIDADTIVYKSAFASEVETDWGNDQWTLHSDMTEARDIFDASIRDIITQFDNSIEYVLCFSSKKNFRKKLLPDYKANRKKIRKPIVFKPLREWAEHSYNSMIISSLEADDVLGLHAHDNIMVSIDKDLKTIPGKHFNPNDIITGVYEITKEEADYNHMMQTLCGDSTDGYSGCPKVGPKTAEKILDVPPEDRWSAVVEAYKKQGLSEKYATIQAQVARILRPGEYNWDTCKLNLWSPEGGET